MTPTPPPPAPLSQRIEARRRQLEAEIVRLKDETSEQAQEAADRARAALEELQELTQNGWDDLSQQSRTRLDELLDGATGGKA